MPSLEGTTEEHLNSTESENQTHPKDQLGVKGGETKLLGVPWNKTLHTIQVIFPAAIEIVTERDPLGLRSPRIVSTHQFEGKTQNSLQNSM